jgi:hypothetical protein
MSTIVSKEHVAFSFRVEEYAKQETSAGLPPAFMLVSCLAYSLTLKMEVTYTSETSADFQQTTGHFI